MYVVSEVHKKEAYQCGISVIFIRRHLCRRQKTTCILSADSSDHSFPTPLASQLQHHYIKSTSVNWLVVYLPF